MSKQWPFISLYHQFISTNQSIAAYCGSPLLETLSSSLVSSVRLFLVLTLIFAFWCIYMRVVTSNCCLTKGSLCQDQVSESRCQDQPVRIRVSRSGCQDKVDRISVKGSLCQHHCVRIGVSQDHCQNQSFRITVSGSGCQDRCQDQGVRITVSESGCQGQDHGFESNPSHVLSDMWQMITQPTLQLVDFAVMEMRCEARTQLQSR